MIFLKFHPGLKLKVFEALVSTANEVGIGFAGHVSTSVGIQRALGSQICFSLSFGWVCRGIGAPRS